MSGVGCISKSTARHVKKFGHGKEFHGLRFLSPSHGFFCYTSFATLVKFLFLLPICFLNPFQD